MNKRSLSRQGELNPNWRGGIQKTSDGYIMILLAPKKRALEHRLVIERAIGKRLEKFEIVHHKNGIKTDNRLENLDLMTKRDHDKYHLQGERHPFFGKHHNDSTKKKISKRMTGNKNALKKHE